MLKDMSDIDCVVMINDLPYLRDVSKMSVYVNKHLANANRIIEQAISNHAVKVKANKFMVKATLNMSGVCVDVDLLPTADNLAEEGKKKG